MTTTVTIYRLCVDGDMENRIPQTPPVLVLQRFVAEAEKHTRLKESRTKVHSTTST